jgi:LDH2 family malate/lactate/ureidoglycolate dehydrogenase
MAMTNAVPNVVILDGRRPVVGKSPLSIAIPSHGEFPLVLDMAHLTVSGDKLFLASKGRRCHLIGLPIKMIAPPLGRSWQAQHSH